MALQGSHRFPELPETSGHRGKCGESCARDSHSGRAANGAQEARGSHAGLPGTLGSPPSTPGERVTPTHRGRCLADPGLREEGSVLCPDSASGAQARAPTAAASPRPFSGAAVPCPCPTHAWQHPPQGPPSSALGPCPPASGSPGRGHGWSGVGAGLSEQGPHAQGPAPPGGRPQTGQGPHRRALSVPLTSRPVGPLPAQRGSGSPARQAPTQSTGGVAPDA